MLKRLIKSQDGSVFIVTLMILVVLSILGTAVINTTLSNNKMSVHDNEFQSVYYVAESGVRHVENAITTNIEEIYQESDSKVQYFNSIGNCINDAIASFNSGDFSQVRGTQPDIDIALDNIVSTDDSRIYTFISTGDIDGITRQAIQRIEVKYPESNEILADMAVFADGNINLSGSGKIIGPVGTNLSSANAISISGGGGVRISGDCYLPAGAPDDAITVTEGITLPNIKSTPKRNYQMPTFPEFPSYGKLPPLRTGPDQWNQYYLIDNQGNIKVEWWSDNYVLEISQNAYIPKIDIVSDTNLVIKTDTDINLVVDDISVAGSIDIIGSGSITLYVNNTINLEHGTLNKLSQGETENTAVAQLTIYYKGTEKLTVASNLMVYASVYAKTAKVALTAGSGYMGHIVTGSTEALELSGDTDAHSRIIYAPFAPVICTASGKIEGSIICKSIEVSGAAEIEFVASDEYAEFPFEVQNPGSENLLAITPIRER